MTQRFEGRVALVTGGAQGIGRAVAERLAADGATVGVLDLKLERAEATVADMRAAGHQALGHSADLTDEAACRQLVALTVAQFGGLDGLIHNAGWVGYQPIEQVDASFIDRAMGINVQAPLWLCKHAWPHLKVSTAPRIVLTTSDRALYACYAQTGLAAYAAGKMAQLGIMNALSEEGAAHGILVNAVSPVARTRMWGEQGEPDDLKPEWVVPGVVYLVSEQCQVTAQVLRASNGQFHALRLGDGQLGRRGAEDVPGDGVGNTVRGLLGDYFRGVRAQAVEAAAGIRLDMHLGAFAGKGGHQVGVEHRELAGLELDDDGVVAGRDHLAVEGLGVDGEAQR